MKVLCLKHLKTFFSEPKKKKERVERGSFFLVFPGIVPARMIREMLGKKIIKKMFRGTFSCSNGTNFQITFIGFV
jgi:hypothetical protein